MDERLGDALTIEELSAYREIPKLTPYKLVREGKVPCQKIGRYGRFRRRAAGRWLEETPGVRKTEERSRGGVLGGSGPGKDR